MSSLSFIIHNRHFLPIGRADLTAPAALRPIRVVGRVGGDHSFMVRALHLQHPTRPTTRLVNNPGSTNKIN
jgi:hypothetical protein